MNEPATYTLTPPAAPALLSPAALFALADAVTEEWQGCQAEPATAMGYWPSAVAVLLEHVDALTARALKAEARVKEQQSELDEMEREKFTALVKLNGAAL